MSPVFDSRCILYLYVYCILLIPRMQCTVCINVVLIVLCIHALTRSNLTLLVVMYVFYTETVFNSDCSRYASIMRVCCLVVYDVSRVPYMSKQIY